MDSEMFLKIALAIISIVGAVITGVLIPYLRSKITTNKLEEIQYWVNVAVTAAEQIFNEPKMGDLKKKYVLDFLSKLGVNLTEEELNVLIEAAVKELNLLQEPTTATT